MKCSLFLMMMMMMMNSLVYAGPTGLTLKLIHSDSPNSPLYPGRNLTQLEIIERAYQRTIARARHHQLRNSNGSSSTLNIVRPRVSYNQPWYLVQLGIGTFPDENPTYKSYYFILDTGSDLLWLQCEPSRASFPQDADLFNGSLSYTYRELHTSFDNPNRFCAMYNRYEGDSCGYFIKYADGSSTKGVLATEKLTVLGADNGQLEVIDNFVFGCGLEQNKFHHWKKNNRKNLLAGILGLGGEAESFLKQLGDRGQYKFEYCLELWTRGSPSETFLRFGSDTKTKIGGGGGGGQLVQSTAMFFVRAPTNYYVNMVGISVNGAPVIYEQDVFGVRNDATGGCIFDSGTPLTLMSPEVYDPLLVSLMAYFAPYGIGAHQPGPNSTFQICFDKPNWFNPKVLPKIGFHFKDFRGETTFQIQREAAFFIDTDKFCFQIIRLVGDSLSVTFGAIQQANNRVLYDVGNLQIAWSTEACVANS